MSDDSPLSRREKELFSNTFEEKSDSRKIKLSSRVAELPHSWGDDSQALAPFHPQGRSLGMLFFLVSFLILILAGGFTTWKFISHGNEVSSANIVIDLTISPSVEGGETTPLFYSVHNKNSLPLLQASLLVTYEKGTGVQDEQNKIRQKIELGDVASGEVRKGEIPIQLYGAENTSRLVEAKLTYKVTGSNNAFDKIATISSILKSPPVSVRVDTNPRAAPEQAFPITVTVKNNVSTTTEGMLVQLVLPASYVVTNVSPASLTKGTVWQIESLASGEEKIITVSGFFKGAPGETASIKAVVGSRGSQAYDIGNVYSFEVKEVAISNPGITAKISARNQDGGDAKTSFLPGERVTGYVTYTNASEEAITDVSIVVTLKGAIIDPKTITVDSGLFDSPKNTITWNGATTELLKVLLPKARGTLMFTFVVPQAKDTNTSVSIEALTSAQTTNGNEQFSSKDIRRFFIEGGATVSASVKYADSVSSNTGPLPPRANQTTTYTIALSAGAQNGFQKGKITLSLPLYVTWLNQIVGEAITYDSRTRVVTWIPLDVGANQSKKVSFKVGVRPSITHVGSTPHITSGITFDGMDTVSQLSLKRVLGALTTRVDDSSAEDISTVVEGN